VNKLFFENLLPGTVLFKRFELVRCLCASEVGAVYLCKSLTSKEEVALKVIAHHALREQEQSKQFRHEVELSLSLKHPNVVKAHDFFWDDAFVAFSMEYVENGTLADIIDSGERPSVPKALMLLSQICSGLAAIHEKQIVHRDLKPENVLIDREGNAKITDFGIASSQSTSAPSSCAHLLGTVNYLSPEYVTHGHFDERSDIYAFGVIAYELLTGKAPFHGDSLIDTLVRRVRFDPKAPREVNPEVPRALSDLALKAMHRLPEKRYQSANELLSHLELIRVVGDAVLVPQPIRIPVGAGAFLQRPAARVAA
jgi:serine/threonine-protein kinase